MRDLGAQFLLVTLQSGERIDAHTVVWAAGVGGAPLARSLGVPLDKMGRVPIRRDLSVIGLGEQRGESPKKTLFVIGDLAACVDAEGRTMPGLAPVAIQQGRFSVRRKEPRLTLIEILSRTAPLLTNARVRSRLSKSLQTCDTR